MDVNYKDKAGSKLIATEYQEKLRHIQKKSLAERMGFADKTLWDFIQLLVIPLALLGIGSLFSYQQNQTSLQSSQKQHDTDLQIAATRYANDQLLAADQQRETTLQTYLDDMSKLLLDNKLLESKPGDAVRQVARERTLTTLRRLDAKRNGIVLQFLQDAHLIGVKDVIINLSSANLSNDDLSGADLRGVDLSKADLRGADLTGADLSGAHLSDADLSPAFLSYANLSSAKLDNADLSSAYLYSANLSGADLSDANLSSANLSGANLSDATMIRASLIGAYLSSANLSSVNLSSAKLDNADLSSAYLYSANIINALVLQRDFTSAAPAIGPEVACDETDRRRACGVADRRSKPRPQAHPTRAGARRPARASGPG